MAKWNEIRSSVSRAANSTVKKTEKFAETASMHVKLARLMSKRDEQFEKLGKLTYKQLKTDESYAEEIAAIISQIDSLGIQIVKQKAIIEQAKAEKEAKKAKKAQADMQSADEEECVDAVKEIIDSSISD
ncbi:MAG: hypothetical protein J6U86_01850 [Clostridia bacterium]|nr:hypothetical protein [Clostridia bacterium]